MQEIKNRISNYRRWIKSHKVMFAIFMGMCLFLGFYIGGIIAQVPYSLQSELYNNFTITWGLQAILYGIAIPNAIWICLVVALLLSCCVHYFMIFNYKNANIDPRNFKISEKGTYGTAREMSNEEREETFQVQTIDEATENIIGHYMDAQEVTTDEVCTLKFHEKNGLNRHKLIAGGSGSRKTRSQIIPDVFQYIERGESYIATDPKGELFQLTSEIAKNHGYVVKVYNLINPIFSDSVNYLAYLNGEVREVQELTNAIFENTSIDGRQKGDVWENGEKALMNTLILLVCTDINIPPEERNLAKVYEMITTTKFSDIDRKISALPPSSEVRKQFEFFKSNTSDDKGLPRTSLYIGLGTRLQAFNDNIIRYINMKDEIQLTLPGKKKCAYYILMSDQTNNLDFFSSLFFTIMTSQLCRYADRRISKKCKVPVNLVFDEFNNIGTIPNYSRKLAVWRSRDIRSTMVIQDIGQLQNRYPNKDAETIESQCDTAVFLGANEINTTAKHFSDRTGVMTMDIETKQTQQNVLVPSQLQFDYRNSEGQGKRNVYTPDEIVRLHPDHELVFVRGHNVCKLRKFDYSEHPMANEIKQVNQVEHIPVWWKEAGVDKKYLLDKLDALNFDTDTYQYCKEHDLEYQTDEEYVIIKIPKQLWDIVPKERRAEFERGNFLPPIILDYQKEWKKKHQPQATSDKQAKEEPPKVAPPDKQNPEGTKGSPKNNAEPKPEPKPKPKPKPEPKPKPKPKPEPKPKPKPKPKPEPKPEPKPQEPSGKKPQAAKPTNAGNSTTPVAKPDTTPKQPDESQTTTPVTPKRPTNQTSAEEEEYERQKRELEEKKKTPPIQRVAKKRIGNSIDSF